MRIRHNFPILREKRYRWFMHTINTALSFDCNDKAQLKLHVLKVLAEKGWDTVRIAFPGVSRASAFRWRKHYLASGKKLTSLIPQSTRPKRTRQMVVPAAVLGVLKQWRQQYPHLSKYKLKVFLDAWCEQMGLEKRSASWIGKVLTHYQLFFGTRKQVKRKRSKPRSGYRIYRCPNVSKLPVGYLQLDGVKIYWNGDSCYFLCALEVKTRQAWVLKVSSITSLNAKKLLELVLSDVSYQVHTIHTDNGSEFKASFDQAVTELKLTHLWSPPRTPKVHAHIERFNKTLQEEFVDYYIDEAMIEPDRFTQRLVHWLHFYNTKRPHHSLGLLTPEQYLLHLQKGDALSLKCP